MRGEGRRRRPSPLIIPIMIGIIGIGNILLKDDGVGIETVRRLDKNYRFPENVQIIDGGTLSFSIPLHQFEKIIVIDAYRDSTKKPGEIVVLNREEIMNGGIKQKVTSHDINLFEYLYLLDLRGEAPEDVFFVGIVPKDIESSGIGLTETIEKVLPEVERIIIEKLKSWGIRVDARA